MARTMTMVILIIMAGTIGAAGIDRWSGGVKAGLLFSFAENEEKSSIYNIPSGKFGPKAGLFCRLVLPGGISIQPELQFTIKGTHYYSASSRHSQSVHFYYLEVPVMVNAMVIPKVLEIFAGPYGAILLGYRSSDKSDWTWEENELKNYDYGVCLGIRFWRRDFSLELQLARGFVDILPSGERGHHNMAIALQLGYRLFR